MALTRADTTLRSGLSVVANANLTGTPTDAGESGGNVRFSDSFNLALTLLEGTSANQADVVWNSTSRSIGTTAETIDLYDLASLDIGAGAGNDALGVPITLASVVLLAIKNTHATQTIVVGGNDSTNANWTTLFSDVSDKITIRPGGGVIFFAPDATAYAVTDSTDHMLDIQGSGAGTTYDIFVLGRDS